jgi:hypothetical protein
MAKFLSDTLMDQALNYIKNNVTEEYLCTSQPADRAAAIAAAVASKTGLTSAAFTLADGDVSGRKVTTAAANGLTASAGGTATHIALCSGTVLLLVGTVTSQVVTSGNTVNIPAFDYEIADVTP